MTTQLAIQGASVRWHEASPKVCPESRDGRCAIVDVGRVTWRLVSWPAHMGHPGREGHSYRVERWDGAVGWVLEANGWRRGPRRKAAALALSVTGRDAA